jgi:hypothetical protein
VATQQVLNLSAGYLRVTAVLAEGTEPLSSVAYAVYGAVPDAEGHRPRTTSSNRQDEASAWFLLPAKRYFVTATYGNASAGLEVEVTPAGTTSEVFNLRAGVLRLSAVLAGGVPPVTGVVTYEVYTAARDIAGNRKRITGSNHSPGPSQFVLPSGRYFVTAANSAGTASAETPVTPGQTRDVQLRLGPATR